MIRQAISPRLAIRMRLNMQVRDPETPALGLCGVGRELSMQPCTGSPLIRRKRPACGMQPGERGYFSTTDARRRPRKNWSARLCAAAYSVGDDPLQDFGVDVAAVVVERPRRKAVVVGAAVETDPGPLDRIDECADIPDRACRQGFALEDAALLIVHDPHPCLEPCLAGTPYPLANGVRLPVSGRAPERFKRSRDAVSPGRPGSPITEEK